MNLPIPESTTRRELNAAKRQQRTQWWSETISDALSNGNISLLNHPAILKCVEIIEEKTKAGEKVLVFGRFTRPMRSLVNLLNARQMLRCLDDSLQDAHGSGTWPQAEITENDEGEQWAAVQAAHGQLDPVLPLDKLRLNSLLTEAYKRDEASRKSFRDSLIHNIKQGLSGMEDASSYDKSVFCEFVRTAQHDSTSQSNSLAMMSRSIGDLLSTLKDPTPRDCAVAFCQIISAMSDRDSADVDADLDEFDGTEEWNEIWTRLDEETSRTRGGFARLMFGGTSQESRQMMRLAFNRPHSFPRVLVAQSLVGREGLNLHEACRCVVLLHPEWNPGVVEQQIGRVDRVNSHWSRELKRAIDVGKPADELPQIEFHSIIFQGTYDAWNWDVLNGRWDALRAQLHGMIVPPGDYDAETRELVKEIERHAPNFSPLQRACHRS